MEISLEIVVWFFISFAIGIAIFGFITGFDYDKFHSQTTSMFTGEDKNQAIKGKSLNESILETVEMWKSCGFGDIAKNQTIYILNETPDQILTKELYFERIKEWNLCNTVSSDEESCGNGEDLNIALSEIELPKIVFAHCDPTSKKLILI